MYIYIYLLYIYICIYIYTHIHIAVFHLWQVIWPISTTGNPRIWNREYLLSFCRGSFLANPRLYLINSKLWDHLPSRHSFWRNQKPMGWRYQEKNHQRLDVFWLKATGMVSPFWIVDLRSPGLSSIWWFYCSCIPSSFHTCGYTRVPIS